MTATAMAGNRSATELLELWEQQQAAYVTRRDERFALMLDVLSAAAPPDGLVLDLACGPGSVSTRVTERFPGMRCVGVDNDPALLRLARAAAAEQGRAARTRFVDADLHDPAWVQALDGDRPDAVLTSTALHWLPAPVLVRLYGDLAHLLDRDGVVVNADHLRADTCRRLFTHLADQDDQATQRAGRSAGAPTWQQWFALLAADDSFAADVAERARRFADRPPNPDLDLGFHVEALSAAGFAEVGPIWQHLDDYVVLARR